MTFFSTIKAFIERCYCYVLPYLGNTHA